LSDLRRRLEAGAASQEAQDMRNLLTQMEWPKLSPPKNDGQFKPGNSAAAKRED